MACFAEPLPSVTYYIGWVWKEQRKSKDLFTQLIDDLDSKTLDAFRRCVAPGKKIAALNWQHNCYWLYPHLASTSKQWGVPVLPDGDYYIFLGRDFRFGLLGQPWEKTICVFGQPLLDAFEGNLPTLFNRMVRKNGQEADSPHSIRWNILKDRSPEEDYVFAKTFLDGTHVEISVVHENGRYRIKSMTNTGMTVSYHPDRYTWTDSLEWAVHRANIECDLWDNELD